MRTTITIDADRLSELMSLTGAKYRSEAIHVAIEAYVRRAKVERLLGFAGRVAILSNDEIEAMDEGARRGGHGRTPGD